MSNIKETLLRHELAHFEDRIESITATIESTHKDATILLTYKKDLTNYMILYTKTRIALENLLLKKSITKGAN